MTDELQTDQRRVLIVDDEASVVTSIAHILKSQGLIPLTATDWVDAVEVVTNDPPDAILLDMHMPRVDGVAFLKFIRNQGSTVPVIVVSAFVDEALKKSLVGLKVSAFVAKPFDMNGLCQEVERVLPLPEKEPSGQGESPGVLAPAKEKTRIKKRKRRQLKNEKGESHWIVYVGVGIVCLLLTLVLGILF